MDIDDWEEHFTQPYEQRDQEDQAEAWHNQPLRVENRRLLEETMRLKKLLRENRISWSPSLALDPKDRSRGTWSEKKKISSRTSLRGRSASSLEPRRLPTLPAEIIVMIIEYAMTSEHPVIDPLSKSKPDAITADEKKRSPQLAIGFIATCKAYNEEATKYLWSNNTFVFTSHLTLQHFSTLDLEHRRGVKHITMRIIARYYDDEDRGHTAPYPAWSSSQRSINLRVVRRPKESSMARRGFRSYTWNQVIDFLDVLRPPFDPDHPKGELRPRLLPGLESLRIDLVNFPSDFLISPGGSAIHNLASHDLASTLNELQLTGITECHWGSDLSNQLARLVKDDGLLLKADSTFVLTNRLRKTPNKHPEWKPRVVRAWKALAEEYLRSKGDKKDNNNNNNHNHNNNDFDIDLGNGFAIAHIGHHHHFMHHNQSSLPPVPAEEGAPESHWKERRTLWKKVPVSRDEEEREWIEFDRTNGQPINPNDYEDDDTDVYDVDELVCHHCGVIHSPHDEEY